MHCSWNNFTLRDIKLMSSIYVYGYRWFYICFEYTQLALLLTWSIKQYHSYQDWNRIQISDGGQWNYFQHHFQSCLVLIFCMRLECFHIHLSYNAFSPFININFVSYFSLFSGEYSSKMNFIASLFVLKKKTNLFWALLGTNDSVLSMQV